MTSMVTGMWNTLIIVLVAENQHLQMPLAFFLGNSSSLQTLYSSTTLHQFLYSFLAGDSTPFCYRDGSTVSCTLCMN